MNRSKKLLCFIFVLSLSACGGGGGNSDNNDNINNDTDGINVNEDTNNLSSLIHLATFELPYHYEESNIIRNGNNLILAGGQTGQPEGWPYWGHKAYSNEVYVIDLVNLINNTYTIDEGFTEDEIPGIGNQTIVKKLNDNEVYIYGGFQYADNLYVFNQNVGSLQIYPVDLTYTQGLNTMPFYTNLQDSVILDGGSVGFFGFRAGLGYGMPYIMTFNGDSRSFVPSNAELTIGRYNVDAHKLLDGRVILIGGVDSVADTGPGSASRRVDIYDPVADTITQASDYPVPLTALAALSHSDTNQINENEICVGDYKYIIAEDRWESECDLIPDVDSVTYYPRPEGYEGSNLGAPINGLQVVIDRGRNYSYSSENYDENCECYPYEKTTTVHVFRLPDVE